MAKHTSRSPLPTIWHCPDELWEKVFVPVLSVLDPPARIGRPRIDQRRALDGVIYHLRTGCQWNSLPRQFGDDASVHCTFQRWVERGVLQAAWALLGWCSERVSMTAPVEKSGPVIARRDRQRVQAERGSPTGRPLR